MYAEFLKGLKVCIYLRKSRTDLEEEAKASLKGEKYDTLQKHRTELLRFAKDNELIIVDIFEEVISGSTIDDRNEIQNVLANVKQNKYDAILCIAYDRLSRGDKEDQGKIENVLKKNNTLILTPHKLYDLNSEEGETSAEIDGFLSRLEYRRIKNRMEAGKHRSALLGQNVSSKVPFGYRKDPETKKLIPHEDEASIVKMIYSLCIEGYGCSAIATKLYNLNIKTKKGNDFTKKTVADIIKNVKYKGSQFYGATKNKRKSKSISIVDNVHECIVSPEDWNLANNMLKQRIAPIPKTKVLKNPFASILKCAFCNKTMKATHSRETIRLVCTTLGCTCRSSSLEVIEVKIIEAIYDILARIDIEVTEEDNNILDGLLKQREKLDRQLEELQVQRTSLHELLEKKIYTPEIFLERQQLLNKETNIIEEKKILLNEEIDNELNKHNNAKNLKPIIVNCIELYFLANPTQRNKLLKSFISKITYKREKTDNLERDIQIEIFLK